MKRHVGFYVLLASALMFGGLATSGATSLVGAGPVGPSLTVSPTSPLVNNEQVIVSGKGLPPGRHDFLIECNPKAASGDANACLASTQVKVTTTSQGLLLPTVFTLRTGKVGNGTCGTSAKDTHCVINLASGTKPFKALRLASITFPVLGNTKGTLTCTGITGKITFTPPLTASAKAMPGHPTLLAVPTQERWTLASNHCTTPQPALLGNASPNLPTKCDESNPCHEQIIANEEKAVLAAEIAGALASLACGALVLPPAVASCVAVQESMTQYTVASIGVASAIAWFGSAGVTGKPTDNGTVYASNFKVGFGPTGPTGGSGGTGGTGPVGVTGPVPTQFFTEVIPGIKGVARGAGSFTGTDNGAGFTATLQTNMTPAQALELFFSKGPLPGGPPLPTMCVSSLTGAILGFNLTDEECGAQGGIQHKLGGGTQSLSSIVITDGTVVYR